MILWIREFYGRGVKELYVSFFFRIFIMMGLVYEHIFSCCLLFLGLENGKAKIKNGKIFRFKSRNPISL